MPERLIHAIFFPAASKPGRKPEFKTEGPEHTGWVGTSLFVLLFFFLFIADTCRAWASELQTHIHGQITVDPQLDPTGDYSGIELLVRYSAGHPDTLYFAKTLRDGSFSGTARFASQDFYLLEVYRNNRLLSDTTLVLAHRDTVHIRAVLPRFSGHARIVSVENNAMQTLNRLDRQYARLISMASLGGLPRDTIPVIMDNWSDIYWQVFQSYPGTLASGLAARESLGMLEVHHEQKMMRRLREYGDQEPIRHAASQFGFAYQLRNHGLDRAIAWMDSLEAHSTSDDTRIHMAMNRIIALYDSSRTREARDRVADFEERFMNHPEAMQWLDLVRYDIEYLSSGMELPGFAARFFEHFASEPHELNHTDFLGDIVLIEIVRLADPDYQMSYQELQHLYESIQPKGVQFLTFPLENSPVTVRAFYQERGQNWLVAQAGEFSRTNLADEWNIYEVPVRFLVDRQGRIIRKMFGSNVQEIRMELEKALQ